VNPLQAEGLGKVGQPTLMIPTAAVRANSMISHDVRRGKEATRKLLQNSIVAFFLEFRRSFQVADRPLQIVVNRFVPEFFVLKG
jgi:hypothetical protein